MIRVLVAGEAQQAARTLADAGFEVVYTGPTEMAAIASIALQEAADAIVVWTDACADHGVGSETPTLFTTDPADLVGRVRALV